MILLQLFLTFFEIGAFTFGGGYAMISIIREMTIAHGWIDEAGLLNFIAVAESTPGPFALNMATFIGTKQAGPLGAVVATFGIVLPSFLIILLIASVLKNLMRYKATQAILAGIRPCVVALILATAGILCLSTLFGVTTLGTVGTLNPIGIGIFAAVALTAFVYKRLRKKAISPILLILLSAVLGGIFYSL